MLGPQQPAIAAAADRCGGGLDKVTLTEGIVHAVAPGLIHPGYAQPDPLDSWVRRECATGQDAAVAPFHRFGLGLRPLVSEALRSGASIRSLLPHACGIWQETRAGLERCEAQRRAGPRRAPTPAAPP